MQTISETLWHELIDNSVSEIEELTEALIENKNPTVCRAIQNEIDELNSALDTIGIWNILH